MLRRTIKVLTIGPCSSQFLVCILNENLSVKLNFTHGVGCIYCGKSDVPQAERAWKKAMAIADLLLPVEKKRNYEEFLFVSTATHYHTVDVEPRWSKSLSRLNQIGRHIFYLQQAILPAPNGNAMAYGTGETVKSRG